MVVVVVVVAASVAAAAVVVPLNPKPQAAVGAEGGVRFRNCSGWLRRVPSQKAQLGVLYLCSYSLYLYLYLYLYIYIYIYIYIYLYYIYI